MARFAARYAHLSSFRIADETLALMPREMTAAGELETSDAGTGMERDEKCATTPQSAGLLPCIVRLRRPARPYPEIDALLAYPRRQSGIRKLIPEFIC